MALTHSEDISTMIALSYSGGELTSDDQDIGNGIRAGHAYSLLELMAKTRVTPYMAMCRNPWGNTEFTGR